MILCGGLEVSTHCSSYSCMYLWWNVQLRIAEDEELLCNDENGDGSTNQVLEEEFHLNEGQEGADT